MARLLVAAALVVAPVGNAVAAAAAAPGGTHRPQVLVLTGSDPYLPAFVAVDAAMRDAMRRRHQRSVNWAYESIDAMRFGDALMPTQARLLQQKYEGVRLAAIVLVTETAVDFYLRHGRALWPGVPVVFHSVKGDEAAAWPPGHGMSGVLSAVDYAGTARIALVLQPAARRLIVVAGLSAFDQMELQAARQALAGLDRPVQAQYLIGLSPAELAARLASADRATPVLYVSVMRDDLGQIHSPRDVLQTAANSSAAPIYGAFETYLGHGLAAGSIEPFEQRGERAAWLLAQALDGQLPPGGAVERASASRCIADGRQLARFDLAPRALPQGCELRFVEPSFLHRYWIPLLLVTLVFALQSMLIAALLLQRRRRRVAEASLQAQRLQLLHASRLAVAGELTASIAHEINQPLGAILANAEAAELMLDSGADAHGELRRVVADIRRDDLRASEVIRRLRALLARHATDHHGFGLNRLVDETVQLLHAEARRRGVTLDVDLGAQRDRVSGDPVQLQQVLLNLVLNAFDASAHVPEPGRRVVVETADVGGQVELRVRDQGSGIAPADTERVFDPFFSTKRDGMGLGLAIARSIVEAHGGTIAAASRAGAGAEFRISLPRGDESGRRWPVESAPSIESAPQPPSQAITP